MDDPTITVSSGFGRDKSVTEAEFVKQWSDHVSQVKFHLCDYMNDEQLKTADNIINQVQTIAQEEFSRLLKAQAEEAA